MYLVLLAIFPGDLTYYVIVVSILAIVEVFIYVVGEAPRSA